MHTTILFYNDAPVFGGHELMSARLAAEFSKSCRVVYFHAHEKICDHLPPGVETVPLPFASHMGPLAIVRNIRPRDISWLRSEFGKRRPDSIVVVQGAIDLSLRGAIAARRLRVPAVSYLPMAFPFRAMGLRHGWLFDRYRRLFYRLFDAFITISAAQRDLIRPVARRNAGIFVIENCVEPVPGAENPVRAPHRGWRVGVVGRLEWRQKDLPLLLEIAAAIIPRRTDLRFVIVGDGPDRGRLEQRLREAGLASAFEFRGWVDAGRDLYADLDLVLMTSRFEGVPLVLIEALERGKCVLARIGPGTLIFKEYLPDGFLFAGGAAAAEKLAAIERTLEDFSAVARDLRERVLWRHGGARFSTEAAALLEQLPRRPFNIRA